jgi:hypothetical protein
MPLVMRSYSAYRRSLRPGRRVPWPACGSTGRRDRARRELRDQAAVYGVLSMIEGFGLELLEVRRLRG